MNRQIIQDNQRAKNNCIILIVGFIFIVCILYYFCYSLFVKLAQSHSQPSRKSITGVRGVLKILSPKSIQSEKKDPIILKFRNADYLILSKYTLHQMYDDGPLEVRGFTLDSPAFTHIFGYKEKTYNPVVFSIAYDSQNNAILIPTGDFESFSTTYNELINTSNCNVDCNSMEAVQKYLRFIENLQWPDTLFERLMEENYNFTYNEKENTIKVYGQYVVKNVTNEEYESLRNKFYREEYLLQKEYATVKFCGFSKIKAWDGDFILYNVSLKISKNGKINFDSETLLRKKCSYPKPSG